MARIFSAAVRLRLNGEEAVRKGLSAIGRSFSRLGRALVSFRGLAVFGGLTLGLRKLASATIEQEQAQVQLAARLRTTGGAAGFTAEELQRYAGSLQEATTFGDEAIIAAQAVLATFTRIRGEAFQRTTDAALDMATVMGTDLRSAVVQLGKALNDPRQGLEALSRAGVTFTLEQRKAIREMVKTDNLLGAQKTILAEIEMQIGGAARAMRNTFGGALRGMQNALGDLLEGNGPNLTRARESVESFTEALKDPDVKAGMQGLVNLAIDLAHYGVQAASSLGRAIEAIRAPIVGRPGVAGALESGLRRQIETTEARRETLLSGRHGPTQSSFVRASLDLLEAQLSDLRDKLAEAEAAQSKEYLASPLSALEQRFAPAARPASQAAAAPYVSRIDTLATQAAVRAEQQQQQHDLEIRDRALARLAMEQAIAAAAARVDRDRERSARDYVQTLVRARDAVADELRLTGRTVYERELLTAAARAGIEARIGADQTLASWLAERSEVERELVDVLAQQLDLRREEIELLQRAADLERSESPLDGIREGLTRVTESVESGATRWAEIVEHAAQRMGFPRTCGDRPVVSGILERAVEVPPHVRG